MTSTRASRLAAATVAVAAIVVVVYEAAPSEWVRAVLAVGLTLAAVGTVAYGLRLHRPRERWPWLLLAGAQLSGAGSWVVWERSILATGSPPGFGGLVDLLWYPNSIAFAVVLVVVLRRLHGDWSGVVEGMLLAVGVGLVTWIFVLEPVHELAGRAAAAQVTYSAFDVLLFSLLVRVAIAERELVPARLLVYAATASLLATDLLWNWLALSGAYVPGGWYDAGWVLVPGLLAGAALHPSMRRLVQPRRRGQPDRRLQAAYLTLASLLGPAVLALDASDGELHPNAIAAGIAAIAALVLVRLLALARALSGQRERLADFGALLESTDHAVFSASLDGTVRTWNRGAERLYGYTAAEMVGRHWAVVAAPGQEEAIAQAMRTIRAGESLTRSEAPRIRADGTPIVVQVTVAPVRDEDGEVVGFSSIATDVTERRRLESELARFFDLSRDVIAVVDADGTVLRINDAWERLTGLPPARTLAEGLVSYVDEEAREAAAASFRETLERGSAAPFTTRVRRPDGEDVWLEWRAVAPPDEPYVIATATDVTDRLRLERLKDEFVASVSHELRTPLTSIRGYVELLLDEETGALSDEQRRFLEVVERNSRRLLALVNDLLFVSRVESQGLPLELDRVDLADVAHEAYQSAGAAARHERVDLRLAAEPVEIEGDAARLGQALDNLLSNAIKFTPAGGSVRLQVGSRNGSAVVAVSDTGTGIPPEDQQRLFERFYRAPGASTRPGTGLGLAIVKAIVDAHGGEIGLRSAPERGTTVTIELPLAQEPTP